MPEGLILAYQQPHRRVNKIQQWHREAASHPLIQLQSMCGTLIEKKIIHIHYIDLYDHALA